MNLRKYGRWALVTGASSGIGRAFAFFLAESGLNLILVARRENRLLEIKKQIDSEVITLPLDLTKDGFMDVLIENTKSLDVGILINNAGIGEQGEFYSSEFENMVKLNCLAPALLTRHFLQPMLERGKGAVIFLGSVMGYHPIPYMTSYSATKAFNLFLGEGLWYELKHQNIDVLTLSPGSTKTEFNRLSNATSGPLIATPQQVVRTAFKALGRKPSVIHGMHNKFINSAFKLLSRKQITSLSGYITKSLLKKKQNIQNS